MRILITVIFLFWGCSVRAQQETDAGQSEDAMEMLAEKEVPLDENEGLPENDSSFYRRHPLPLNQATASELQALQGLSDIQIAQLLQYRRVMGHLISLYELQAVPGWDIATIRKLLPYLKLDGTWNMKVSWKERFTKGSSQSLVRFGRIMDFKNYRRRSPDDVGSPDRLLLRYTYQYRQWVQWGVAAEKDAGESLRSSGRGFDFYTFHVLFRQLGKIQTLALGDFTVNLGQGLIQWQNLAFRKGGQFFSTMRQAPLLKPYRSVGEFNFYRGIGLDIRHGHWEGFVFGALQKIDAHLARDSGLNGQPYATALVTSGYHRTENEKRLRRNLGQTTLGGRLAYRGNKGVVGINSVYHAFTHPFVHGDAPYQRYYPAGRTFLNSSIDYAATINNWHVFGELALNENGVKAWVSGLQVSLHAKLDATILMRAYDPGYTAWYSNPFAESSRPGNEQGCYGALNFKPAPQLQLYAYFDCYRFPWLRYRTAVPGWGQEVLVQCTYTPAKKTTFTGRLRRESGMINYTEPSTNFALVSLQHKIQFRLQAQYQFSSIWGFRSRMEWVKIDLGKNLAAEEGLLALIDVHYAPAMAGWQLAFRGAYYDTDSYNGRIYAYENDLSGSFGVQLFYGKGIRWSVIHTIKSFGPTHESRKWRCSVGIKLSQNISYLPISATSPNGHGVQAAPIDMKMQMALSH